MSGQPVPNGRTTWTQRIPSRLTFLELAVLLAIPVALAAIYHWTPQPLQAKLALDHAQPKLHAFWTTSYVHEPRPDDSHLLGNIKAYLLLIIPIWILYRVNGERKRFWAYLAIILIIGPFVINTASYLFYNRLLNHQVLDDRGFSSLVGAIDGLLILSILNTAAKEQEEKVGALSTGLFFSYLILGFGFVTVRPIAIGVGVLLLVGTFAGVRLGYFAQIDRWLGWAGKQPVLAAVMVIAGFVSAVAFAAALPSDITSAPGSVTNIASHGFGIIFGLSLEYQRTVRKKP